MTKKSVDQSERDRIGIHINLPRPPTPKLREQAFWFQQVSLYPRQRVICQGVYQREFRSCEFPASYQRDRQTSTSPSGPKRTKDRCKAPAVRGWRVCRFHGARGGAPEGKRNGMYRHGLHTKEAAGERRFLRQLLQQAREVLATSD